MRRRSLTTGLLAAGVFVAACSEQTQQRAENAARETEAAVESAAGDAVRTAEAATDAVRDATNNADPAGVAQAAIETLDVKTALLADRRVDASGINVDTDHRTKIVTLKGHVPSTDQRTAAAEIARAKAPGYQIDNLLLVP